MSSSGGTNKSGLVKRGSATQECKEVVRWNATCHGISLELEALQLRCQGGAAPLAWLDVDGLASS
jgi:hypothetical protein